MKTYLQMDGDKLVEYVEKREYESMLQDLLQARREYDRVKQSLNQQLQDAVKRMEDVTDADLVLAYWAGSHSTLVHEGANRVRARLIQAAKGDQL